MFFLLPLFISTIIYVYSFIKLGNTVYRTDSNNQIKTDYTILLTEGIFGHIRTLYYSIIYNNSGLQYLKSQIFQWYNPFFTFPFIFILFYSFKYLFQYLYSILKKIIYQRLFK